MSDSRYPERWLHDRRLTRLSDRGHRAFVTGMTWAVANRTDGVILAEDLADLPAYVSEKVDELVTAGLWSALAEGTGFLVVDYLDTQSSRAELEKLDAARVAAREKKALQRSHSKATPDPEPSPMVPRDVPRDQRVKAPGEDVSRGTSRGTTQARPGQARPGSKTGAPATRTDERDWPDVAPTGLSSLRSVPEPAVACTCNGYDGMPLDDHMPFCPAGDVLAPTGRRAGHGADTSRGTR